MDENYLDSLLNEVSSGNNKKNNFDNIVETDSGIDIDMSDIDNISLDELDELDSLDLGDLELDDIDFDDLDVTRLDTESLQAHGTEASASEVEDEDFNLDELISNLESESAVYNESDVQEADDEEDESDNVFYDADMLFAQDISYPNEFNEPDKSRDVMEEETDTDNYTLDENAINNMDLDDLFSALGIEDDTSDSNAKSYTSDQDSLDELFETAMPNTMNSEVLDDIADIRDVKGTTGKKNKKIKNKRIKGEPGEKKSISEILFGEPDEDDLEEEKLLNIKKAKKAELKEKKKVEKDARDELKKERLELKKREESKKKSEKAAKKKEQEALFEAELAGEKKVSTSTVITIFAAIFLLGVLVIFGTKEFNYSQVIRKAADYFDRQRYRLAYDEVAGVEVKNEDTDLRDRIYTVMYVERLYESYENNMQLNRPDKALDALLRGLEKYDEHYDEAISLRIVEDINYCKDKIINALWNTYGLSETRAYEIMELTGQEYLQALYDCCDELGTGE